MSLTYITGAVEDIERMMGMGSAAPAMASRCETNPRSTGSLI